MICGPCYHEKPHSSLCISWLSPQQPRPGDSPSIAGRCFTTKVVSVPRELTDLPDLNSAIVNEGWLDVSAQRIAVAVPDITE